MQTISNTERFNALKKLSDLRVEYHKNNIRDLLPFTKNLKGRASIKGRATKVENLVSIAQVVFKIVRSIRSK